MTGRAEVGAIVWGPVPVMLNAIESSVGERIGRMDRFSQAAMGRIARAVVDVVS